MRIPVLTAMMMVLTAAGPALAQGQAATPLTPKHRLPGSYVALWMAQDPKQDPKPEPKTEAKPDPKAATAATLAGKWTVNVETQQGPMESSLELKADPKETKKVTGTIVSQMGEAAVAGEVVDGKLTFSLTMSGGSGDVTVGFTGTLQKDGSLAGTFNFGQGDMPWTAVRVKK